MIDQFHHRLRYVEERISRSRTITTLPVYDLQQFVSISRNALVANDGGFVTANAKGMILSTNPVFIEIEFMIPQLTFDTIDNHQGYTAAPFVLASSNINVTGGPFDGVYIQADSSGTQTFTTSSGAWVYGSEQTGANQLISPAFDPTIIHTQRIHLNGSSATYSIDGTTLWTDTLSFSANRYYVGAIAGTGIGGNSKYYIASIKIGTTLGGDDIFFTDFSTSPIWDYSIGSSPGTIGFTQTDLVGHYTIP